MPQPSPQTFQEQLEHVLKSLHEGTYAFNPDGQHLQAMIVRMQHHELSRDLAAHYVYPPSGATLVTGLAFERRNGWMQGASPLRQLAQAGVDTNIPDAHGRVGSIQGLANRAGMFDENTVHWAVQHGANAALTEVTTQGARSWLSMDFGESKGGARTPEFWKVVQTKVNTALRKAAKQDPDGFSGVLARMADAPVHHVHTAWFAGIKARYLDKALDKVATNKSSPRSRM